ncbi:hypothetical protein HPB48_007781 [Haemaphysalis longicornis]|uniref:Uncharacterized protein n=1 Tax=Haemaphysalis longicornis TaxID=44386 RepID=A0A9J6GEC1_HAELO|nr:hypothetical protein HPB48_007781 [Haemaphysalis longicornis]
MRRRAPRSVGTQTGADSSRRHEGFSGCIKLKHAPKLRFRLCILGDQQHCEEARANGLACRNRESILAVSTRKRRLERLTKKYDAFLASPSVYEEIPEDLLDCPERVVQGPDSSDARRVNDDQGRRGEDSRLPQAQNKVARRGHRGKTWGMPRDELAENVCTAIEKLDDRLKGNWTNILNLHLKTCGGDPRLIY